VKGSDYTGVFYIGVGDQFDDDRRLVRDTSSARFFSSTFSSRSTLRPRLVRGFVERLSGILSPRR
jgi:hypothetical protein